MMAMVSGRRNVTLVPCPGLLRDFDRAAQAFHPLADHVHAHAATGDIGHLLGGRKPRLEKQRKDLGSR